MPVLGFLLLSAIGLGLAGCAPVEQSLHRASTLTLGFIWPHRSAPTLRSSFAAPSPPKAVIVHWNPKDYTHAQIAQIAGQQCLTFDRRAKPARGAARRGANDTQRFDCVVMAGKAADGAKG